MFLGTLIFWFIIFGPNKCNRRKPRNLNSLTHCFHAKGNGELIEMKENEMSTPDSVFNDHTMSKRKSQTIHQAALIEGSELLLSL